ncbi:MAG: DUF177 domain-containing protein [Alphaproteobacteria bacterium]|nr:DUF177 domain-containing protein [Alphaproteobacteria bacterium]
MSDQLQSEWQELVAVAEIATQPTTRVLSADEPTRAALAERFGLIAIHRLGAKLTVRRRQAGRLITVTGHIEAELEQTCVVTLEPFTATVVEEVALTFAPAETVAAAEVAVDGLDDPEPLEGDWLDLGEVAAQALSLALDPYPRAPGVAFEEIADPDEREAEGLASGGEAPGSAPSPFAALSQWRRDKTS